MDIVHTLNHSKSVSSVWCPQMDVRDHWLAWKFGMYNTLILCHGVTHLDWFEVCPFEKMKEIVDVNLFGTANMIQRFVCNTLSNEERKKIIVIGSMAHKSVLNGSAIYCATKAGVAMLTKCIAWELAPKAFDVYCIHPSNTYGTPMTEETILGLMRYRQMSREHAEAYWNDSPIRNRILDTCDISQLILFLLGSHSEYLSGCQLELAGGQR